MGEIKSTLDLVMEKTKNLNLSDEERQAHKNKKIQSRLSVLLQKFKDQLIGLDQFQSEYQRLRGEYSLAQDKHLIKAVCQQIELGEDNQPLLELLSRFTDSSLEGIASVLKEFDTRIEAAARKQAQILTDKLAREHFISGSAVVPNLEIDEAWRKKAGEIRAQFEQRLNNEKTRLIGSQ